MSKKITLKDVASHAGVSYQTVSKVLNGKASVTEETKNRIWEAVQALNYKPNISAQNLRTQLSHRIGYAWRGQDDNPPILDRFLYKAAETAESYGYHLLTFLIGSDDSMDTQIYKDMYDRRQVDGFLLADTNQNDPRIKYLLDSEIPFTSFGQANPEWDFCWVDVDGKAGISSVMNHLLAHGHNRIGFIGWPEESLGGQYREAGYIDCLKRSGIEIDSNLIIRTNNSVQAGVSSVQRLFAQNDEPPTAVVCISDLIAIGVMNGLAASGYDVGRDVAVTGYDDMPMSEFLYPSLTTVRQPITAVGQAVMDLLIKQIRGKTIEEKGILLKPSLVVRDSSNHLKL